MQKRAMASSSSGQPSQRKRPCVVPIDPPWNGSEANPVRCCCVTKEYMQSMCTQMEERLKSGLDESIHSARKDILSQISEIFSQMKEAMESAYGHSLHLGRSDAKSMANNGARNLQLQIRTKLSLPVFTGKEIKGEEGAPINIALIDANTGEIVTSGPQSSIKLDVLVLEGDFNKDNEDNWAPEEFLNYVVKERKGKRPLLTGELVVKLKEGVGELGQMIFTDNSSWNRSKTFRIGLEVASGSCGDTRIREAITEPFPVKEHRGEAYKKHHPPASDDDVWRLENIAKDGKSHQKLSEAGMYKVEDFLPQLFTDSKKLRGIEEAVKPIFPHWAESMQSCIVEAIMREMRPMLERVISQEVKEAFRLANISSSHLGRDDARSTTNNCGRNLQLLFRTNLSLPLFTGKKLEGEKGTPISVALIDANTGDIVTSGPESFVKLHVVVLEGGSNEEDANNWTHEEFENHVIKERDGKRPLLTGNLQVTLKGGTAELEELMFTDNSSWNKSKRFRIGLKVATGYCGNTRIREAKTEAFRVKEYRGEAYKKHHPPASDDEVWRLEKIAKDGRSHDKLKEAGIIKVEDFLLQLFVDPKKLKDILGNSITSKNWDILVQHAKTRKTNSKLYLSNPDGMHGAIFTIDRVLIGLIKDREYFATHRLSAEDKELGDTIVKKAFDNWSDCREFNGETFSVSMQKKNTTSFPSQVVEGQTENLIPVQRNLVPRISAAPVGLEAPMGTAGSTAEGHTMEFSVDESVCLVPHHPIPPDRRNVLKFPGENSIPAVGLALQSHDINIERVICSPVINSSCQMDYTEHLGVLPSEACYASRSTFQPSSSVTENFQSTFPDLPDCLFDDADDSFLQTPTWENRG